MPGDRPRSTTGRNTDTDTSTKLPRVEIGELIFGGTIAVNDQFETSVPGLFCGSIFPLPLFRRDVRRVQAPGRQAALKASGMSAAA